MTAEIRYLERRVRCEACCLAYFTRDVEPNICPACVESADEAEMRKYEAQARAAGFASLDARIAEMVAAADREVS